MLLCTFKSVHSQNYVKLNTFNTDQGLPSNHIYDIIEDNKGFLWISTDNGVSRFDGKYFQNFSVAQGLPSNEVLQILKSKDGTIWVNCYKQTPAYFNEKSKQFISIKNNPKINEIAKSLLRTKVNPDLKVAFFNSQGSFLIDNKTAILTKEKLNNYVIDVDKQTLNLKPTTFIEDKKFVVKILISNKHKNLDSLIFKSRDPFSSTILNNNQCYLFLSEKTGYRISVLKAQPLKCKIDTINCFGNTKIQKIIANILFVIDQNGTINMFEKNTLKPLQSFKTDLEINNVFIDKNENIWVATLDKGLVFYSKSAIKTVAINKFINPNFLSIATNGTNEIIAGNYYGEILQVKNSKQLTKKIQNSKQPNWIRKIIFSAKNNIALSDLGYNINFGLANKFVNENNIPAYAKTACLVNDSLILIGSNFGLIELNTHTFKTNVVQKDTKEIITKIVFDGTNAYYISEKGLYKYEVENKLKKIFYLDTKNGEKPISLAFDNASKTLWVSTYSGKMLIIKDDKIIDSIPEYAGMPESVVCMLAHKNRIWLGSKTGISIIDYGWNGKGFNYKISNASKNDGLPSNTINDFSVLNDTIYTATENGIAKIPANYKCGTFIIKPELVGVKINQAAVNISNHYSLKSNQNNIALQFAGVELGGHFKNLQYAINDKSKWSDLEGNTLTMQLGNGNNDVFVRAKDVNNRISSQIIQIHFFIETPFYKQIWFWSLMVLLISLIVFWIFIRRKLTKQRTQYEKQLALEKQRSAITADLHDDIGATLSSLQINSAVANQLLNKNPKQTQKILHKIENQAKNLSDKIGDIIWSMKPGKDEFMTLASRIKTFANDILGATDIHYEIHIDNALNTSLKDIEIRKNVVFIVKEAINNLAKYSKATKACIDLRLINNEALLIIKDNGIGFLLENSKGNGLNNMQKRTEELKGKFKIKTALNFGTEITIVFPLIP